MTTFERTFATKHPFVTSSEAGTLRTREPQSVLQWLWDNRSSYGVSRVSSIGNQDRLGLPIFNVVRPDAMLGNLTVSTGKGRSAQASAVSALAEAYERHWGEPRQQAAGLRHRSSLGPSATKIGPDRLAGMNRPEQEREVMQWMACWDLTRDREVYLPAEHLLNPYRSPVGPGSSDGLAAGCCLAEGVLHALLELIERDACSFGVFLATGSVVEHNALPTFTRDLIDQVQGAGIEVTIQAFPAVLGIPVFRAVLDDTVAMDPALICAGQGAHLVPSVAVDRALLEAAQTRACVISGGREDLAAKYRVRQNRAYMDAREAVHRMLGQLPRIGFDPDNHEMLRESPEEILQLMVTGLRAQGHEVYARRLTPSSAPIAAVAVAVSRLEAIDDLDSKFMGARFRSELRRSLSA